MNKAPEKVKKELPDNLKWLFQFELEIKNLMISPEFSAYFDEVRERFRDLKSWKQ